MNDTDRNERPETLAAILAEMRKYDNEPPPKRAWLDLADRIEAAAERERENLRSRIKYLEAVNERLTKEDMNRLAEHCLSCAKTINGNAAVMRMALLSVRKPIDYRGGDLARYTLPVIDAALKTPQEPVGNAAMMRMALEVLWDVIGQFSNNILDGQSQLVLSDMLIPAKNAYHLALSAPPRNCDRFATAGEAMDAFFGEEAPADGEMLFSQVVNWLFAPAEGGAE